MLDIHKLVDFIIDNYPKSEVKELLYKYLAYDKDIDVHKLAERLGYFEED